MIKLENKESKYKRYKSVRWRGKKKTINPVITLFLLIWLELDVALEALTKPPIGRNDVESCFDSSIAELNFERKRLAIKVGVALPVSSPVSWHSLPFLASRAFNPNFRDLTSSSYVWDENQLEIVPTIHCESHPSTSSASNPITIRRTL